MRGRGRRRGAERVRFSDRAEGGRRLAEALRGRTDLDLDLVLGIPRGGICVAEPVAEALGLPLDVCAARKVGAPFQPELAMGAVTRFGVVWNERLLAQLRLPKAQLEAAEAKARREVERRERQLRGGAEPLHVAGRRVALVDDGLATGATMAAAVQAVRQAGARRVVAGVPVASEEAVARIKALGADVVAVAVPYDFMGVGQFFVDFSQVAEAECLAILRRAQGRPGITPGD